MSPGDKAGLDRVAEAITDEITVDWNALEREQPDIAPQLGGLRLLERIASLHRTSTGGGEPLPGDAGEAAPAIGSWGPLQIRAKLGEGAYGTVYLAHDPRLQRDVALKLVRDDLAGGVAQSRRILTEARLMARVRHPNVLVVHGADEHEGRVGFWTDLVQGVTLEQRLRGGEILGPGEAALCGRELCRALAAVHAAGLTHGDVKAANVMRDHEGHLVLMDFGAGLDGAQPVHAGPSLSGTPLVLAPEVLAGAPPSPASDLYALGVLLYRLVSGRYPVEAGTMEELKRLHVEGSRVPLLDRRPDLPASFAAVVERALAVDPSARFATAGELEGALAACLADDHRRRDRRRMSRKFGLGILALAAVLAVAAAVGTALRAGNGAAVAPLTGTATLVRTGDGLAEPLADAALVHPGDTLGLIVQLSGPAHVYVLNEDQSGAVFVLFPLRESDLHNPLSAERPLRLPGARNGATIDWQVTAGRGEERFLVIAARAPIAWLEEQLAGYAVPAAGREVSYPRLDPAAPNPDRGVGGVAESPPPPEAGDSVLDSVAHRLADAADDHSAIWMHHLVLYNLGR